MDKRRTLEAESISHALSVYIQRQSGLLHAECVREGHLEKGELHILIGQPIYARAEKLIGQEALNYMLTWHFIHFSFTADAPRPPANLSSRIRISLPTPTDIPPSVPSRSPTLEEKRQVTGIEWLVPQKIGSERFALSLPLTYYQRLIYFLIDGQRTIADLARCSNKTVTEIESILRELRHIGLITGTSQQE